MTRRKRNFHGEQKRIENLIDRATSEGEEEIKAYLSQLTVVRISGYFEQRIQNKWGCRR